MKRNYWVVLVVASGLFTWLSQAIQLKVLLNAEPFGFGPSAAIAEFFPYLRKEIKHLAYIGEGHTLDLQRTLDYDHVFDYGDERNNQKARFEAIAKDYDVFITASNYQVAEWAKELDLKLIIYDPLTWYWPTLPAIIKEADLYIAQNFFGVAERIESEFEKFPETIIVSALIPELHKALTKPKYSTVLVNMGGLSNPYVANDDFIIFAKMVFNLVKDVLGSKFEDITYVTSATIAQATHETYHTKTLQPQQIQKILSNAHGAIMTSGLGNIYEASALQRFVVWLPAANDSQGQQVTLLRKHKMLDFAIDWHEILDDEKPIDYFAPQQEILKCIAHCIQKLSNNFKSQEKFKALLQKALNSIESDLSTIPVLAKLAQHFGTGGAQQAAKAILKKLTDFETKKTIKP